MKTDKKLGRHSTEEFKNAIIKLGELSRAAGWNLKAFNLARKNTKTKEAK